jgi:hypothetical protein
MNILEGKGVKFTSGPWEGCDANIGRRSKKGIWDITVRYPKNGSYQTNIWWDLHKIKDKHLFEYSEDVRILLRDVRLANLLKTY